MLRPISPTWTTKSFDAAKMRSCASNWITAPTPIAWKSCAAAAEPRWPALWISLAATDSGKGSSRSSTITRRRTVTNMMPRMPPTIIRALAVR